MRYGIDFVATLLKTKTMPPSWEITCQFVVLLIASFIFMKLINFMSSRRSSKDRLNYLIYSPVFSIRIWDRRTPLEFHALRLFFLKAVIIFSMTATVYSFFPALLDAYSFSWSIKAYLAVLPFLFLAYCIGFTVQLILLPFCGFLPPFLDKPLASKSLSEFWGRRWNPWVGGWFWEVVFRCYRRRPIIGVLAAFAVSGLWHDLLIALPLWNLFGENIFGMMTVYFLIQAAGVILEHRCLGNHAIVRRIWTWLVILLPVPLMLNRGTLLIFHLSLP